MCNPFTDLYRLPVLLRSTAYEYEYRMSSGVCCRKQDIRTYGFRLAGSTKYCALKTMDSNAGSMGSFPFSKTTNEQCLYNKYRFHGR